MQPESLLEQQLLIPCHTFIVLVFLTSVLFRKGLFSLFKVSLYVSLRVSLYVYLCACLHVSLHVSLYVFELTDVFSSDGPPLDDRRQEGVAEPECGRRERQSGAGLYGRVVLVALPNRGGSGEVRRSRGHEVTRSRGQEMRKLRNRDKSENTDGGEDCLRLSATCY